MRVSAIGGDARRYTVASEYYGGFDVDFGFALNCV
jgi:hypothetical protein